MFLQLFNEINSRKVNEEWNVFEGLFTNYMFGMILLITVFVQVIMVEFFGDFAQTTGLTWSEWLSSIGIGAISIPIGFLVRLIPVDHTAGRIEVKPRTFEGAVWEKDTPGGETEMAATRSAPAAAAITISGMENKSQ